MVAVIVYVASDDARRGLGRNHYWGWGSCGAVAFLSGASRLYQRYRKDKVPDALSMFDGVPLESAGVQLFPGCSPSPAGVAGPLRLWLFFQNRYDAPTSLKVKLRSRAGGLEVAWDIDVQPGEAGFIWKDRTLAEGWKPGPYAVDIAAEGHRGSGPEVRFTKGRVIRGDRSREIAQFAQFMHGHLSEGGADHFYVVLEQGLETKLPPGAPEGRLQLWSSTLSEGDIEARRAEALRIVGVFGAPASKRTGWKPV